MDLPSFDSFFSLLKLFTYSIGLLVFKPRHRWSRLDKFFNMFGYFNVFCSYFALFCSLINIFSLIQSEQYFFVIGVIPGTLWSGDECLNYVIILYNKDRIIDLMKKFKNLYDLTWTENDERFDFIAQIRKDKKRVLAYFKFYILNNLVYSLTPLLITFIMYFLSGSFNPIYVAPFNLYPFDKKRFYWLVFVIEFLMARASMVVVMLPDVMVSMFIIQLVYQFECLGAEIFLLNQNRNKTLNSLYRKSLVKAAQLHQHLLE